MVDEKNHIRPKLELKNWVAAGNIQRAIDYLIEIAQEFKENEYFNKITAISGRFNVLKQDYDDGVISYSDYELCRNKIIRSTLSTIDLLPIP